MRINSIKIENLFEIFNYDIAFKNKENVLIITGPNGYGKTMILNIIFSLFNRKFQFFQTLVFDKITLSIDEDTSIVITKTNNEKKPNVSFSFFLNEKLLEKFDYTKNIEKEENSNLFVWLQGQVTSNIEKNERKLIRNNQRLFELEREAREILHLTKNPQVNKILGSIQVHLIQEQRLFKKSQNMSSPESKDEPTLMIESIQTYARELRQLISDYLQKSFTQTQELDSSYPNRLRSETNIFTEGEYEKRYKILKIKQKKLAEFSLYESKQEFLTFSNEDAKALSVYLKDFELKLGVFDALLEKLELFTNILNERRFTFKSIHISKDKGFLFKTSKGKELDLSQLSSGEQHEVVLLYELIFNVKPNVLVLIDEPEISLHITWQKEFLKDLLKIVKIQNIQVLIATHSPSIIDDRWDLVYNLETEKVG